MKVKSIGANKTELELKDVLILISYETPVAAIRTGLGDSGDHTWNAAIRTDKQWSNTTTKHINQWLSDHDFKPSEVPYVNQSWFNELLEDNTPK